MKTANPSVKALVPFHSGEQLTEHLEPRRDEIEAPKALEELACVRSLIVFLRTNAPQKESGRQGKCARGKPPQVIQGRMSRNENAEGPCIGSQYPERLRVDCVEVVEGLLEPCLGLRNREFNNAVVGSHFRSKSCCSVGLHPGWNVKVRVY
jgi:hypothetical protein